MPQLTRKTVNALAVRIALALLAILILAPGVGIHAQSPVGDFPAGTPRVQAPQPAATETTVVLKLGDEPVAVVRGRRPGRRMARAEQDQIAQALRAKQDALVPL